MYIGEYRIDDYVTLIATTHRFSSGAAYAPTSITYRVYEDATDVEIVADTTMTNFDTQTGFYLNRIQCTAALGYEAGKTYTALIKATVDSVAAITAYTWRILTPPVNVTQWLGTACATPTVNGVPEVDLTHVAGATNNVSAFATNVDAIITDTADMQPKLGTPAGASISADILVIDNFVDGLESTIGVAGAGLTDINLPNQTMDIVGNITGNLSGSVGSVTGAVGSVTAGVTLAASAVQAIWDALTSALGTVGSVGKKLADWVIGTTQTGDTYALANGANGFIAIKADTAATLADTGTDGVVVASASKTGYSILASDKDTLV